MDGLDWNASGFNRGVSNHETRMKAAILAYAKTEAARCESHAKVKAPWQDRTGNARNSIQGSAASDGNVTDIVLSGNMEYSPYLELGHEKRFAILYPTIEELGPDIIKGLNVLLGR